MRNTLILLSLITLSIGLRAELPRPIDATKATAVATKTPDSKRWKDGYIVTLKGDTIQGKIKVLDFLDANYDYQKTVAFKDSKGVLQQYSPIDLKSFSFSEGPNNSMATLQSVSRPDGTGRAFLRIYYSGQCKVYGVTIKDVNNAVEVPDQQYSMVTKEKKYIQVQNSQFFPIQRAGFKKNMKEVFASNPRILNGLNSGEYTYKTWQVLVMDYNKQSQIMQESKQDQVVVK